MMGVGLAILLLALGQSPAARGEDPPTLVVQVVDPIWLPLPGIAVNVTLEGPNTERKVARTGVRGFAEFRLERGREYTVEVHHPGFKRKRAEHVRIPKADVAPTAYVQLHFELKGSGPEE